MCMWVIVSANTFMHIHSVCIYACTFVHVVVRACGRILYMRILTRKLMACIFRQDAEFHCGSRMDIVSILHTCVSIYQACHIDISK